MTMLREYADLEGVPESQATDEEFNGDLMAEVTDMKRNCIVDLWPFACPKVYYSEILRTLGAADRAGVALIFTPSAHPSPWLACSQMGLETFVFTRR